MGIQTHDIVVGDNQYTFNTFSATRGINLFKRIVKVIGPSFGSLFEGKADDEEQSDKSLAKAVSLLCDNLDKEDVVILIKDLLQVEERGTKVNGNVLSFDNHFAANYGELMQVLFHVFRINYSDFLAVKGFVSR